MDILEFREYCLSLPLAEESTPFDETTLVFKVQGKMFAVGDMVDFHRFSVKCDPARAVELRERYPGLVQAAYHFNKVHWNMVSTVDDLPDEFLRRMIHESYGLVVAALPRAKREEVAQASGQ